MDPNQQGYYNPDQNQVAVPQPPQDPAFQQPVQPVQPVATPTEVAQPVVAQPIVSADQAVVADVAGEEYEDEGFDEGETVTWNAHEYIHMEKGATWYMIFGIILVASVGLTIWLQQWTFTILLVVIAVVIVVNSKRPPRELTYTLNDEGLTIDNKLHKLSDFKSFGIVRDGEHYSVMLIPIQRFQPSVSVYFPEESGEAIVDMLGARLPMKELHLDAVDHLVRWLRL